MKVVKLGSRHTLYKKNGIRYALRFDGWDTDVARYENAAKKFFGVEWSMNPTWKTHWSKLNSKTGKRPYWIGMQTEAMIMQVMLAAG